MWLDMTSSEDEDLNAWCEAGYDLVARGQVAVLLIAGGGRGGGEASSTLQMGGRGGGSQHLSSTVSCASGFYWTHGILHLFPGWWPLDSDEVHIESVLVRPLAGPPPPSPPSPQAA